MDVVVIFNGLGNQMSQYSFFLAKKLKNKSTKVIFSPNSKREHNGSELDRVFNIRYNHDILHKILGLIFKIYINIPCLRKCFNNLYVRVIREPYDYVFNKTYLEKGKFGINFFVGGWHSEKYFYDLRDIILEKFSFNTESQDNRFKEIENRIRGSKESVSIHVRRGDFVNHPDFGGIATIEYYNQAIDYIKQRIKDAKFYCFSNDIEWCKKYLKTDDIYYIDINGAEKSWRDLCLMSCCRHHIMSNSSFSWWGTWLSQHADSINICPRRFIKNVETKDVYPEKWVKL